MVMNKKGAFSLMVLLFIGTVIFTYFTTSSIQSTQRTIYESEASISQMRENVEATTGVFEGLESALRRSVEGAILETAWCGGAQTCGVDNPMVWWKGDLIKNKDKNIELPTVKNISDLFVLKQKKLFLNIAKTLLSADNYEKYNDSVYKFKGEYLDSEFFSGFFNKVFSAIISWFTGLPSVVFNFNNIFITDSTTNQAIAVGDTFNVTVSPKEELVFVRGNSNITLNGTLKYENHNTEFLYAFAFLRNDASSGLNKLNKYLEQEIIKYLTDNGGFIDNCTSTRPTIGGANNYTNLFVWDKNKYIWNKSYSLKDSECGCNTNTSGNNKYNSTTNSFCQNDNDTNNTLNGMNMDQIKENIIKQVWKYLNNYEKSATDNIKKQGRNWKIEIINRDIDIVRRNTPYTIPKECCVDLADTTFTMGETGGCVLTSRSKIKEITGGCVLPKDILDKGEYFPTLSGKVTTKYGRCGVEINKRMYGFANKTTDTSIIHFGPGDAENLDCLTNTSNNSCTYKRCMSKCKYGINSVYKRYRACKPTLTITCCCVVGSADCNECKTVSDTSSCTCSTKKSLWCRKTNKFGSCIDPIYKYCSGECSYDGGCTCELEEKYTTTSCKANANCGKITCDSCCSCTPSNTCTPYITSTECALPKSRISYSEYNIDVEHILTHNTYNLYFDVYEYDLLLNYTVVLTNYNEKYFAGRSKQPVVWRYKVQINHTFKTDLPEFLQKLSESGIGDVRAPNNIIEINNTCNVKNLKIAKSSCSNCTKYLKCKEDAQTNFMYCLKNNETEDECRKSADKYKIDNKCSSDNTSDNNGSLEKREADPNPCKNDCLTYCNKSTNSICTAKISDKDIVEWSISSCVGTCNSTTGNCEVISFTSPTSTTKCNYNRSKFKTYKREKVYFNNVFAIKYCGDKNTLCLADDSAYTLENENKQDITWREEYCSYGCIYTDNLGPHCQNSEGSKELKTSDSEMYIFSDTNAIKTKACSSNSNITRKEACNTLCDTDYETIGSEVYRARCKCPYYCTNSNKEGVSYDKTCEGALSGYSPYWDACICGPKNIDGKKYACN